VKARRQIIWVGAGIVVVAALLAPFVFDAGKPFGPSQVTAAIVGYQTNKGTIVAVIEVHNRSRRDVYRGDGSPASVHYRNSWKTGSDALMAPPLVLPDQKVPAGKTGRLMIPVELKWGLIEPSPVLRDQHVPVGGTGQSISPIDTTPSGLVEEIDVAFETVPWTLRLPDWIKRIMPIKFFKNPEIFAVPAKSQAPASDHAAAKLPPR